MAIFLVVLDPSDFVSCLQVSVILFNFRGRFFYQLCYFDRVIVWYFSTEINRKKFCRKVVF